MKEQIGERGMHVLVEYRRHQIRSRGVRWDVVEWNDSGQIASVVRVFEPRPSQRDSWRRASHPDRAIANAPMAAMEAQRTAPAASRAAAKFSTLF